MSALSRLGFGVTGPHATGFLRPHETEALVRAAIDLGVTTFDTGPMYGGGEGERRLGAALTAIDRDDVFIVTKARTFGPGAARGVAASLEDSLRRLRLDHVDALLLHGPNPEDIARLADDLAALRRRGLVRCVGVCGRGPERAAMLAHPPGLYDLLMTPLDDDALLARSAAQGVDILAIEVMRGRGGLRAPKQRADLWYLARDVRDALKGTAPSPGPGLDAALSRGAVSSVIVTTTRIAHLEGNARAAGLTPQKG